jgi:hypothetical protein
MRTTERRVDMAVMVTERARSALKIEHHLDVVMFAYRII